MNKIYVGIDIAKHEQYASVINSSGEILIKPFKFTNDLTGFKILKDKMIIFPLNNIIIDFESTTHYVNTLMNNFYYKDFNLTIINPLKNHALRNINIQGAKTYKIDSTLSATFLRSNNYNLVDQNFIDLIELKIFVGNRQNIVSSCSKTKIQLVGAMNQIFSEYTSFFTDTFHGKASYAILREYQNPKDITDMYLTKLTNILLNNSHRRFDKDKAFYRIPIS